jgi:hypothetical protein
MNILHSLSLALADFSVGHLYGLIGLVGGLLVALTLPAIAMYYHHRRQQLWHETARIALEKGQPMPPQPRDDDEAEHTPPPGVAYGDWIAAKRATERRHDTKGGLVLIAVGAGLYLMMGSGSVGRFIGAIPGLIGVALLLYSFLNKPSAGSRPPQS